MTNNEFYYLLLVIGAFGFFGISLAFAYVNYRAWLKQPAPAAQPAVRSEPVTLRRAA
jgi:hypothetical protein